MAGWLAEVVVDTLFLKIEITIINHVRSVFVEVVVVEIVSGVKYGV